jgi:hypothetical protein
MATQSDIDRSQELQDRGIKKEFQTMRTYVDGRFEEQRSATTWGCTSRSSKQGLNKRRNVRRENNPAKKIEKALGDL